MRLVSYEEYLRYAENNREIFIEDQVIRLDPIEITRLSPDPEELTDVSTTIWSFPKRGSWATHKGDYRGNWAPQIPRALIEMFTEPGEVVLDQMIGSGTTCVEARLLGRNCIGVDISYEAAILTLHRLYYLEKYARERISGSVNEEEKRILRNILSTWSRIYHGDARDLREIKDYSIDLVATHPPYLNIIRYSDNKVFEGDLSKTSSLENYLSMMKQIARESYRVLKPGRYLGILIGDTRIRRHYVPISHYVLDVFLETGFILKEEVVKIQHKMKTTREVWRRLRERDFLLIHHEKLFIFRKPGREEDLDDIKYSTGMIKRSLQ